MSNTSQRHQDYRLIGGAGERAQAAGLVNADWYTCAVPRPVMKQLMQRNDARAIRDTALWYTAIVASGALAGFAWFRIPGGRFRRSSSTERSTAVPPIRAGTRPDTARHSRPAG